MFGNVQESCSISKHTLINASLPNSKQMRAHIYICTTDHNPMLCAADGK